MQIAKGTVVAINYKLSSPEGEHIDASEPGQPLSFLCGVGQIIVGLEEALIGKSAGDKLTVDIPPERAYGKRDADLDLAVPLDAFPVDARGKIRAGMQFQAPHPKNEGQMVVFTVHGRRGKDVMVSGNHPLADKTLHFEVEVAEVREASKEEVEHGHAHGPGGHHHH